MFEAHVDMKITSLYYVQPNNVNYSVENFEIILSDIYNILEYDNDYGGFTYTVTNTNELVNTGIVENGEFELDNIINLEKGKKYVVLGAINGEHHPRSQNDNRTFALVDGSQVTLLDLRIILNRSNGIYTIFEHPYITGLPNFRYYLN